MTFTTGQQLAYSMLLTGEHTRYKSFPDIQSDPARWSKLLKIAHDALVFIFPHTVPQLVFQSPNRYFAKAFVGPGQLRTWIRITTKEHEFQIALRGYKPSVEEIEYVMGR
jgi:hypothetical protein